MTVIDQLRPIAEAHQRTLAHLAINWILNRAGVTTTLVGMTKTWQVDENIQAANWQLSSDELDKIDQIIVAADLGLRILPHDEYLEKTKQK